MRKILVCDDDGGILEVMKIILEDNGFEVKTSPGGKGIQKTIENYNPDLLFLDIWMPGIDGKEITKLLKKDPRYKEMPIVIVSALNDTANIAKGLGADDFLSKPFTINDLLGVIDKNIHKA